jgi:8-oxo-dGTP pyrophosphatase MutT (NUDIX family)
MNLSSSEIKILLSQQLPGKNAHLKLAPPARKADLQRETTPPASAQKSAVMILLFEKESKLHVVYIRRSMYVGIHAAQIAFPGGRYDDTDLHVQETAFREIEEEIGIHRSKIELLGELTSIYVPPSNFLISVYVGFMHEQPVYLPDEREVGEIIELDVDELYQPNAVQEKSFFVPSANETVFAPCFATSKCDIWGASAMVTNELLQILMGGK